MSKNNVMIHTLDLIYEGNFVYAVRDSNPANPSNPIPNKHHICLSEIVHNAYPENVGKPVPTIVFHGEKVSNCSTCREIIATNDVSLELPILPLNTTWEAAYGKAFPKAYLVGEENMRDMKDGFMEGYRSLESNWTNEEVFRFMQYIRERCNFYDLMDDADGFNMELLIKCYQKAKPTGVIISGNEPFSTIKTDKRKVVEVIKWIYK